MKRRALVYGGIGAACLAAGAGAALWRSQPGARAPAADIWPLHFDQPGGGTFSLADFRGKPLLLNFWATWCPPCVGEMPLLDGFHRAQLARGWQVVGLAVDQSAPVQEFLAKRPVGFPIGLAGLGGVDLARTLGNTGGALPFSVVFDAAGAVAHRKLGVLTAQDLQEWAKSAG